MSVEKNLVLLARAVKPLRRTALPGGSALDAAYTVLNQVVAALVLLLMSPLMAYIAFRIWRVDGAPSPSRTAASAIAAPSFAA